MVTVEEIQKIIEQKTGIPVREIQENEQEKMFSKHTYQKDIAKRSSVKQKLLKK